MQLSVNITPVLGGLKSVPANTHKPNDSTALQKMLEVYGSRAGVTVTEKTALQTAASLCAARVLAEGVGQVPIKTYRHERRGDQWFKVEARDHWSWNLLRRAPNDWMTSFEFREFLMYHAIFSGNGYAIINRGAGTGKIMELLPVQSSMMSVRQNDDWEIEYTVRDRKGIIGTYGRGDILHLRGPSWDGFQGLPMVRLAREVLGLSDALQNAQANLQAKGGQPPGILASKEALSKEARDRLREAWMERYGPNGDGGIAILDGLWEFIPTVMSGVDSQHIESRRFQIEEVARFFRVLPVMLMQADKASTYASAEQFFLAHVVHSLDPWMVRLEQVYQRDLLSGEDDLEVELIRDGLLRGAAKDRGEYFAKALGSGGSQPWMTPNEVRAKSNLNPVSDGDQLPKPVSLTGGDKTAKEDVDENSNQTAED